MSSNEYTHLIEYYIQKGFTHQDALRAARTAWLCTHDPHLLPADVEVAHRDSIIATSRVMEEQDQQQEQEKHYRRGETLMRRVKRREERRRKEGRRGFVGGGGGEGLVVGGGEEFGGSGGGAGVSVGRSLWMLREDVRLLFVLCCRPTRRTEGFVRTI
ncbi:hypothetical protein HDV00_008278 [Rhizophlyctis rosea]|nr:hypothetical protein HDV00_008278 [Rhizophlyctis rosea]